MIELSDDYSIEKEELPEEKPSYEDFLENLGKEMKEDGEELCNIGCSFAKFMGHSIKDTAKATGKTIFSNHALPTYNRKSGLISQRERNWNEVGEEARYSSSAALGEVAGFTAELSAYISAAGAGHPELLALPLLTNLGSLGYEEIRNAYEETWGEDL